MVATVRCEILDASILPPTTASEVQMVCPIVAPTATPTAFLCVASCTTKSEAVSLLQCKTMDCYAYTTQIDIVVCMILKSSNNFSF